VNGVPDVHGHVIILLVFLVLKVNLVIGRIVPRLTSAAAEHHVNRTTHHVHDRRRYEHHSPGCLGGPFVNNVAGDDRGQQTGQVGQTIGQAHQYSGEPWRYVQVVDFESRVNAAVETHSHGQYGHCQVRVAARVGRGDQPYRGTELTDGVHNFAGDGVRELLRGDHHVSYMAGRHREHPHCEVRQ